MFCGRPRRAMNLLSAIMKWSVESSSTNSRWYALVLMQTNKQPYTLPSLRLSLTSIGPTNQYQCFWTLFLVQFCTLVDFPCVALEALLPGGDSSYTWTSCFARPDDYWWSNTLASSVTSCASSWRELIIFGCRILYGRVCAFLSLPPTTRNPSSILGSRDLILLCLWISWPLFRHSISSPNDSTCAFLTR